MGLLLAQAIFAQTLSHGRSWSDFLKEGNGREIAVIFYGCRYVERHLCLALERKRRWGVKNFVEVIFVLDFWDLSKVDLATANNDLVILLL